MVEERARAAGWNTCGATQRSGCPRCCSTLHPGRSYQPLSSHLPHTTSDPPVPCLSFHTQDIAPREASVLFHMGKSYKRLGQLDEAMACFASALDLQPPSADTNLIKARRAAWRHRARGRGRQPQHPSPPPPSCFLFQTKSRRHITHPHPHSHVSRANCPFPPLCLCRAPLRSCARRTTTRRRRSEACCAAQRCHRRHKSSSSPKRWQRASCVLL